MTVDFQSLKDNTATVRERDTMQQIRVPVCACISVPLIMQISAIAPLVSQLASGSLLWSDVVAKHGLVQPPAEVLFQMTLILQEK